jgi:prepilin-type N-terminal cleavage/methylation domain-containing protein
MLYSSVPKMQGFTLIEMAVTVLVVGMLGAIAAPNLLAWQEKERVNGAMQAVRSAMVNARHQAMRNGKACRVKLDSVSATVQGVLLNIDASTGSITELATSCISTGMVDLNHLSGFQVGAPIQLWASSIPTTTPAAVTFTFKGSSISSIQVLVYQDNRPSTALGLEVSAGLGITRICRYKDSLLPPSTLTSVNCPSIQ